VTDVAEMTLANIKLQEVKKEMAKEEAKEIDKVNSGLLFSFHTEMHGDRLLPRLLRNTSSAPIHRHRMTPCGRLDG
jgi:hypothetical protein